MSGPKSSRYTLTAEQRRLLTEQRRIERRKSVASESIKRNNKRLLQIGGMFSSEKKVSGELLNRTGNDGGFDLKLKELETIIVSVSPIISKAKTDDVNSLENIAKTVSESLAKAEMIATELSHISAKNEVELQGLLKADIDKGFTTSFADIKLLNTVNEIRDEICVQLIQMKKNSNLPNDLIVEIEKIIYNLDTIEDESFLKNYSSVTVAPLIKRCKYFLDEYEKCHKEFEEIYTEYVALCDLYYFVAQEYPCCTESIDKLKAEIQRIKDEVADDDEQAYIAECIDEVMEEMGYSVLGSREVTKKNGKHFRNELYTYGEGTAVNVTYSSDGRIAMELGGIDVSDRLPDERETSVLCESMEQFCGDFKEIEKRLLAKGVVLSERISMLPPSAEYAQIINTSDYQLTEKVEKLQAKKQQRTAAKRKALRME